MPQTKIIDKVPARSPVASPGSVAAVRSVSQVSAKAESEYVAGRPSAWQTPFLQSLPYYIDDISQDFGDDIYERMMFYPAVAQAVETIKRSVLAQGFRLNPAVGKDDKYYKRALKIRDEAQRNLETLSTPLTEVLTDLLEAVALGNRVAEQVFKVETRGPLAGKLVLDRLKPKPRRAVAFVADSYNNVVGLLGQLPSQPAAPILSGTFVLGPNMPNFLPRKKFAVLTIRKQNGDPRGRSFLRAAYTPWFNAISTIPQHLKYMAQFSVPSLIGTTPEHANDVPVLDANGDPVYTEEGRPVTVDAAEVYTRRLEQWQAGGVFVKPFGSELDALNVASQGAPFIEAYHYFDQQMSEAITGQTLSGGQAQYQSRAASEEHGNVFSLLIQYVKECVENTMEADVLCPWVEYNYGPEWVFLRPAFSLSETEQQDFNGLLGALADSLMKGFLQPSQVPAACEMLGLPVPTEEELALLIAQKRKAGAEPTVSEQTALNAGDAAEQNGDNADDEQDDAENDDEDKNAAQ